MDYKTLAERIDEATEALEMLAGGESGMLPDGTDADSIANLLSSVQYLVQLVEDETGKRFTRCDDRHFEDFAATMFSTAEKTDARRGE